MKVTTVVSFPVTSGFAHKEWPESNQINEQERHLVRVEGDFASGDELANAVFAKMPEVSSWRHLLVQIQLSFGAENGREKNVTGPFGLRSAIRLEFDGLRRRLGSPSRELAE